MPVFRPEWTLTRFVARNLNTVVNLLMRASDRLSLSPAAPCRFPCTQLTALTCPRWNRRTDGRTRRVTRPRTDGQIIKNADDDDDDVHCMGQWARTKAMNFVTGHFSRSCKYCESCDRKWLTYSLHLQNNLRAWKKARKRRPNETEWGPEETDVLCIAPLRRNNYSSLVTWQDGKLTPA